MQERWLRELLLPSERELANTLKVARNVVRGAYEQLMDAGKLTSEGRKGRSVSSGGRGGTKKKSTGKASKQAKRARSSLLFFALHDSPFLIPRLLTRPNYSLAIGVSLPSAMISFLNRFSFSQ